MKYERSSNTHRISYYELEKIRLVYRFKYLGERIRSNIAQKKRRRLEFIKWNRDSDSREIYISRNL